MKIRSLLIALCISFLSFLLAQEEETKYFSNEDEVSFELTREYYLKHYGKNNPLNITLTQFSVGQFPIIQTWNSVTDQIGNSIIGLSADDFMVTENGINAPFSVQQIEGTQSAISVALVIDVSGSMGSSGMAQAKQAALIFVSNMSNFDRASIIKFASNATVVQSMTSNKELLNNAINSLSHGGWTAMYDGFYLGLQQLAPEPGTKALIGFTDGDNNAGSYNQSSVINYANQLNVPIYAIGVGSAYATPLQQMANATGGSYYYAPNPSQIGAIYEQISQSIQEQYKIVFNSPNPQLDGTTRLVEISAIHNGNSATTSFTYNAPLDDPNAPVIQLTQSTINLINNSQVEGNPMTISAIITDDQSIASAKLFYKNSNVAFYQDVNLTNTSGNTFEFTIPGNEVVEGAINFYFTASDNEGNSVSLPSLQPFDYPFSISILPNMPPEIVHEAISYAAVGKVIEISAVVTDNTGDLASVMVFYKNHDVPVYSMINMQPVGKGTYTAQLPEVTDAHYNLTSPIDQRNGIDYVIKAQDEYGAISYFPANFGENNMPHNIEVEYHLMNDEGKAFSFGEDNWFFKNFATKGSYGDGSRELENSHLYQDNELLMWPEYLYSAYNYNWTYFPPYSLYMNKKAWPSWEMMEDAFGNNCFIIDINGVKIKKPSVVSYWGMLALGQAMVGTSKHGYKGGCFGFAVTTSMAFNSNSIPFLTQNFNDLYDVVMLDDSRKAINAAWTKQFGLINSLLYLSPVKPSPNETLESLKDGFVDAESKAMMLWKYLDKNSYHVVNPYRIRRVFDGNNSKEIIYSYDNLNNGNRVLSINTITNELNGEPDHMKIFNVPSSDLFEEYQIPALHLPFKDETPIVIFPGSSESYEIFTQIGSIEFCLHDSLFNNNIVGAAELIASNTQFSPPYGYVLPINKFTFANDYYKEDETNSRMSFMAGNTTYYYSSWVESDTIKESIQFDGITKITNKSNSNKDYLLGIILSSQDGKTETEKVYNITEINLSKNDSIWYFANDNHNMQIRNFYEQGKTDSQYNIAISIINETGLKTFAHNKIEFAPNSTHIFDINWDELETQITIFIDYESNSVIDDTLLLSNQFYDNQIINLEQGWSLISSYREPESPQLESIFSDQINNSAMAIMLGKTGIFWPGQNINTIGNWNPYDGYKVKMNVADQIIITGEEVIDKTANLSIGANFLPVLSPESVSAITIFDQIEDELLFAFDFNGMIYWPDGGIFDLQLLEPGKAYLLFMTADASVLFPESGGDKQLNGNKIRIVKNSPWEVTNTGNPHIISIFEAALTDLKQGDIIAAFNTQGVCVGVTQFADEAGNLPLVVYGDDLTTELVDGLVEGEAITLKVYDPLTQEVSEVYPVWDNKMPNNGQFAENGLSAIMSLKAGTSVAEHSLSNLSIYPNPNTGAFNVTGINEPVEIHVVNTTGQVIEQFTTDQSIEINLSGLAKGIYYLKVVSETNIRVEKIIIR
jgi:VWFA-related protein